MKLSFLRGFLNESISSQDFCRSLDIESSEFSKNSKFVGSSMPIYSENDLPRINIRREDIIRLFNLYLNGQINALNLEYLCNLLELNEKINYDNSIEKILFQIGTPEINQKISIETVQNALKKLQKTL